VLQLTGGLYLGWALGANDASNVFGTAVASRSIGFRTAAVLCAAAIIIGAVAQGEEGIETLSGLSRQTTTTLVIVSLCAAFTVTLMTALGLPISTSQAVVGAILGAGLVFDAEHVEWAGLGKVVTCWVGTPVAAMACAAILYWLVGLPIRWIPMSMLTRDKVLWSGLIVVGLYGSYALGANNVANATGIFKGHAAGLSARALALLGGAAIALGVMTYSRRVMMTVGSRVMRLDAFTAFVAVLSMAVSVHVFAMIGVPVSTSQAIVGAVMGVGFMRGLHVLHFDVLRRIVVGWLFTPGVALVLAAAAMGIVNGLTPPASPAG
jgi:PiT family inorganic phosphate transporter